MGQEQSQAKENQARGETDSYLNDSFPCNVGHQEIHGNIFTVHVSIHPVLDVPRHFVGIQVIKILSHETKMKKYINSNFPWLACQG